ncbi:glycosyltransferase [Photobacterium angustum]|uniref:glycosyltransferase n=1 Tax=Photobacterium angustum TaxID=661 RepID=UPI0005DFDBBD|nr:glycosyltransferase [Photobacterium angustum]KJG00004.1 glycosyl transferase family 1 [Photobacterium angustum]KJG15211.1 glycosyl transferase family 1 [Photobacterium angustum]KJG20183.1 glycosyl transferase family 1 [Photobacterium angustum]KJG27245.1 glycosyl transferase family 1 [Photobacterium angustum]PSV60988.1 glycosyltransferase family 1 protein [Photobacterium angustum]
MDRDIEFIIFGEDWGRHPSSTQHLISIIAKQYPVYWINSIGLRQPQLQAKDIRRIIEKLMAFIHRPAITDNEVSPKKLKKIIKPLVWPLARNKTMKYINKKLLETQLPQKKHYRVLWIALPSAIEYIELCQADLIIYYCGDDFSALTGVDHDKTMQAEQTLSIQADLIYVANRQLMARFPKHKTHYLPHGVDLRLFQSQHACPPAIDKEKKNIGFYGSLNNWLDYDLLQQLALARPQFQFYLLGNKDCPQVQQLQNENIHLLPAIPHHQLASYLQHWHIAILPFIKNRQIKMCNPLKLREYLAAGCPVISSDFNAAAEYSPLVSIATTQLEWLSTIDRITQLTSHQVAEYKQKAYKCVQHDSWERRIEKIINTIQKIRSSTTE